MSESKGIVVDTGLVRELAELLDASSLTGSRPQPGSTTNPLGSEMMGPSNAPN